MKQNSHKLSFVAALFLLGAAGFSGQAPVKWKKGTQPSPLQLRTILYTLAQFTPFDKSGTRTPLSVALERVRVDTSVLPWRTISKKRLFQVNEEAGVHTYHPSPDFGQVIVAFQHADFVLTFFEINDLEWISNDGKRKKRLTQDLGGYHNVAWSTDQKRIAYTSRQGIGRQLQSDTQVKWAVYSHDLGTGKRRKLFEERRENPDDPSPVAFRYLHWLSETQLLYTSTYPKGLFLLDTTGKPPVFLTKNMPNSISLTEHFALWYNYKAKQIRMAFLPADPLQLAKPGTWSGLKTTLEPADTFVEPYSLRDFRLSPDKRTEALLISEEKDGETPTRLVLRDVKTRKLCFVGVLNTFAYGLAWTKDGKSLIFLLDPRSENPKDRLHKSIVAVPVPEGEGVPFEQFDWTQKNPLKYTELFAFPEGAEQVSWSE